ncbi:MAG: hypothetical protein KatS3mg068_0021 [Candidatus Sericytochromatia bacterium]|nr:MAG: hypothetical protein KatS3mg068_0021 [Candidatus Sericytochromatia bacterium]
MSENNIQEDVYDDIESLFDDLDNIINNDENNTSNELIESLENIIEGKEEPKVDFDSETQNLLDELSEFLDEQETDLEQESLEDEEIPNLDEMANDDYFEDEPLQSEDIETEETRKLREEAAKVALGLMNYCEFHVISLENELVILGDAFNELIEETRKLDDKISKLSEKINNAKVEGAKQLMDFIHEEIKLISDNLEGAIKSSDPGDLEILYENIEILKENKNVIENQIKGLKEIGANTDKLEKDVQILESSIEKLQKAIASNEVFSVSMKFNNEINQTIFQIKEAQVAEDIEDLKIINENLDVLMDNRNNLEEQIWELYNKGYDIEGLKQQLEVLNINLEQLSRTIDEATYNINIMMNKEKKNKF